MMEQKKTYEELAAQVRELEEKAKYLETVLDSLPVNIFVKDTDCKYRFANKICDLTNHVKRGDLLGKTDFEINSSKEIAQNYYDDDIRIMATKEGSRKLSPVLVDGDVKYVDIFKEPIIDSEENILGIIGMVIAPEDWGLYKERFSQDFEEYEKTFKRSDSFIFDYDIGHQKVIVLKELEGFEFFKSGELDIQTLVDMENIYREDAILLKETLEKLKNGSKEESIVIRFYDLRKHIKWCRLSLRSIFDKHINSVHAIGVIKPLTDSVVEAEQMSITIDDVSRQLTTVLGNRYDSFMYFNLKERYYHILGLKNDAILHGLKTTGSLTDFKEFCVKYIHKEDLATCLNIIKSFGREISFRQKKDFFSAEFRYMEAEGFYRWKEIDIYQVHENFVDGLLVTTFDVDEVVNENQNQKMKEINNGIIDILSTVVEFRSIESGNHIKRMKGFTKILLKYVNAIYEDVHLSKETMEVIASAAAMHDVGKVAIPDSILLKPGRLTEEEYELMKEHTVKGCEILDSMATLQDENYYKYSYEICRYHHERYDGRGYPDGLVGDDIPLAAQVVAVADVYDALVSKRIYKDAYSHDTAFQMIMNGECGAFDPRLLECFVLAKNEMEALAREYGD
ncbi:MAG: HD domain-containing protein [Lachnospiraceae bacterium]|nr:HD domain-containing protein [Lachnospiraceae bacterium]